MLTEAGEVRCRRSHEYGSLQYPNHLWRQKLSVSAHLVLTHSGLTRVLIQYSTPSVQTRSVSQSPADKEVLTQYSVCSQSTLTPHSLDNTQEYSTSTQPSQDHLQTKQHSLRSQSVTPLTHTVLTQKLTPLLITRNLLVYSLSIPSEPPEYSPSTHSTLSVVPQYSLSTPSVLPQYTLSTPSVLPQYSLSTPSVLPQYILSTPSILPQYSLSTNSVLPQYSVLTQYSLNTPSVLPQYSPSMPSVLPQFSLSTLPVLSQYSPGCSEVCPGTLPPSVHEHPAQPRSLSVLSQYSLSTHLVVVRFVLEP